MDNCISVGDKIEVKIIDDTPDGDGSVLFEGIDEVYIIQRDGSFVLFETGYIALLSEVIKVIKPPVHTQQETDNWDKEMDN